MSLEPLQNRIQQLERLLEVSRTLSGMLDLAPLLQSITEVAADLTYSEESSILLYDKKTKQLEFVAAPWFKRDLMREIRVPLKGSISGEVFTHGQPVLVRNAQQDNRLYRLVDESASFQTRSMVSVPLIYQGKTTGVLSAVNKLGDLDYTEDDVRILETLASQAAIAIKNASLLKESQEAYAELAEFDQMKTDFVAITSHELRTPLGLILGHATFLRENLSEDYRSQIDVIVRSAMRLKEIIEDLSKIDNLQTDQASLRRRPVIVNSLIIDMANTYAIQAKQKGVRFKTILPNTQVTVEGDPEKLSVALDHLVRNAVTFTDEGGIVMISAEEVPGMVKLSVGDTGIGIPRKDLDRIFDRFYQVASHMTRKHGGMGLGLAITKGMVEMHGGKISVESVEGRGSKFTIFLPTSAAQVDAVKRVLEE
ncbi:MAG: GAF domain-containing protein [Anaerolineales bacterium]|nr:GAF domain-containing protein [Anaerolineales bacterium]